MVKQRLVRRLQRMADESGDLKAKLNSMSDDELVEYIIADRGPYNAIRDAIASYDDYEEETKAVNKLIEPLGWRDCGAFQDMSEEQQEEAIDAYVEWMKEDDDDEVDREEAERAVSMNECGFLENLSNHKIRLNFPASMGYWDLLCDEIGIKEDDAMVEQAVRDAVANNRDGMIRCIMNRYIARTSTRSW